MKRDVSLAIARMKKIKECFQICTCLRRKQEDCHRLIRQSDKFNVYLKDFPNFSFAGGN